MKEKICINCKHHVYIDNGYWESEKHRCAFDKESSINLITGDIISPPLRNCYTERTVSGGCSEEGLNFE